MLSISNIPEALSELESRTGRAWTDSEIFDLATNCDIELHAAPPITAQTTIQKFIVGEGLVEQFRSPAGHALLAVLFPWQVAQLWMSGETKTSHPSKHDEKEGEYQWFTEPVRITREQVRIKAATLQKMFAVWSQAQAGRWIEDTTKPGDMRYQHGPEWMFPAEEFALALSGETQNTATPLPVGQATEIKEQRQDRRLKACIDAGLCFDGYKGRLPDGVGKVADREGIKRQSFSPDVKAALKRQNSAKREGVTVHRS